MLRRMRRGAPARWPPSWAPGRTSPGAQAWRERWGALGRAHAADPPCEHGWREGVPSRCWARCVAARSVRVNACWPGARSFNESSRVDHVSQCGRRSCQLRPGASVTRVCGPSELPPVGLCPSPLLDPGPPPSPPACSGAPTLPLSLLSTPSVQSVSPTAVPYKGSEHFAWN